MKPRVIIIRGPSGVGKSSVAHLLSDKLKEKTKRLAYIPSDVNIYPFMRSYFRLPKKERRDITQENIELIFSNFLKRKFTVIIDGIFYGKYKNQPNIERLLKIARKHDAKIFVFELHAHLETLHKRIEERTKQNPHAWSNKKDTELRYNLFMKSLHKNAIVIHTEDKSRKKIVNEIMEKLTKQ